MPHKNCAANTGALCRMDRLPQALAALALVMFACLFAPAALAQGRALDGMEHRRWLAADGGPSQVGAITQTRDGYLWLGTNESLFRFDGFRFVRYEMGNRNALDIVASLLVVDDALWVGMRFGGVRAIGQGPVREFPVGAGMPDGVVYRCHLGGRRRWPGALYPWQVATDRERLGFRRRALARCLYRS
jgi:hypothetical protein